MKHSRTKRNRDIASGLLGAVATLLVLPASFAAETNTTPARPAEVRGQPIQRLPAAPPATKPDDGVRVSAFDAPDARDGAFTLVSFEKLSAFDFFVNEMPSVKDPEKLVLRSTNSLPQQIKAYNGRRVSVTGYVRPLRTQNRLVTEFLLLRDQGTCCFGSRAQMNHFVRVKLKAGGFSPGLPVPYKASGTLRVGEEYVGEFLTSIYALDAEKVVPVEESRDDL